MTRKKVVLVTSDWGKKKDFVRKSVGDNSFIMNNDVNEIEHQSTIYEIWNVLDNQMYPEAYIKDADAIIYLEKNYHLEKWRNREKCVAIDFSSCGLSPIGCLEIIDELQNGVEPNKLFNKKMSSISLAKTQDEKSFCYSTEDKPLARLYEFYSDVTNRNIFFSLPKEKNPEQLQSKNEVKIKI